MNYEVSIVTETEEEFQQGFATLESAVDFAVQQKRANQNRDVSVNILDIGVQLLVVV